MICRSLRLPMIGTVLAALAVPAFAQPVPPAQGAVVDAEGRVFGNAGYDPRPEWKEPQQPAAQLPSQPLGYEQPAMQRPGYDQAAWQHAQKDWLAECRRNHKGSKGKTTGAVLGGVVGGVIGNQIAGEGDRTVGTIAGAAVGAVAGGAIGSQSGGSRARDYCEAYLERYTGYGTGYGAPQGYAYAYQPVMVVMPVMVAAAPARHRECVETTVVEEWVEVATPKRHTRQMPDKRVKIVADKRARAD